MLQDQITEFPDTRRASAAQDVPVVVWSYGALAVAASIAFLGLALLFALTIPYHEFDTFAYGEWSRRIATIHAFDPTPVGAVPAARPTFLVLQGLVWWVTGVSFVAGRLLALVFAAIAVVGTALLVDRRQGRLLALISFLSIPLFASEAIAGKTDVPASAAIAAVAAVALWEPFRNQRLAVGALAAVAVLTKPSSTIPALAGLVLALMVVEKLRPRDRLFASRSLAVVVGALLGFAYEWAMAAHLHMGLLAFLRAGTNGTTERLSDAVRGDTLLRLDFLGPDLSLPLAVALVYAVGRSLRLAHRPAAWSAVLIGVPYAVIGPFVSGQPNGPFTDPYASFAFVGFAILLSVMPFAPSDVEPGHPRITQLLRLARPPTIVWLAFGVYEYRLEAPAWPALAALIGVCLYCSVRTAHRLFGIASLAPIPVLAVALWASLVSFDGFHEPLWAELRALGASGIRNEGQTTNIVLPAVSDAVTALKPQIGADGRVVTSDPHFLFWFKHTTIAYPTSCAALDNADGFILSTSDESQQYLRSIGVAPEPAAWAACRSPRLRELTDGSNGLAAFRVLH